MPLQRTTDRGVPGQADRHSIPEVIARFECVPAKSMWWKLNPNATVLGSKDSGQGLGHVGYTFMNDLTLVIKGLEAASSVSCSHWPCYDAVKGPH